jgi:hypothetical protein
MTAALRRTDFARGLARRRALDAAGVKGEVLETEHGRLEVVRIRDKVDGEDADAYVAFIVFENTLEGKEMYLVVNRCIRAADGFWYSAGSVPGPHPDHHTAAQWGSDAFGERGLRQAVAALIGNMIVRDREREQ